MITQEDLLKSLGSPESPTSEFLPKIPFVVVVFQSLSPVQLFCDLLGYIAHQAPLSMGFPRQEYWTGLPFPSPGDLPDPGIEPAPPALAGRFFTTAPREAQDTLLLLKSDAIAFTHVGFLTVNESSSKEE